MIMILLNKVLIGIMSFWLGCYFCTSTVVQLQLAPAFLADLISKLVYIDFHRVIGPKRKYAFSLLSGGDIQQGTWVRRCEPTMMPPFFPLEQMFFRRTMCAYMCYSGKHIGLIRCFQKHCCLQGKKKTLLCVIFAGKEWSYFPSKVYVECLCPSFTSNLSTIASPFAFNSLLQLYIFITFQIFILDRLKATPGFQLDIFIVLNLNYSIESLDY